MENLKAVEVSSKSLDDAVVALATAGAEILVSGSGIFGTPDPAETIKEFKKL